jgi:hypothetical protein
MPIPNPTPKETEEQYVSRCIGEIYDEYGQEQGAAICYNTYRKSTGMSGDRLVASKINQMSKYRGIYLGEGLEDACWEGYTAIGTKMLDGREVPNCVPETENMQEVNGEIDVFGYETKQFYICPGAIGTFEELKTLAKDEDTIGMIRSLAQIADNVFKIEKDAIQNKSTTQKEVDEAIVLVSDFKDLLKEIEEEVQKTFDVSYMDGHIVTIKSFL